MILQVYENQKEVVDSLLSGYGTVIILDTETTGLDPIGDDVIEIGAAAFIKNHENGIEEKVLDTLVRLPEGKSIPEKISEITGITEEMLAADGTDRVKALHALAACMKGKTLIIGHNVAFDILFLQKMIRKNLGPHGFMQFPDCDLIDTCTILRKRKAGGHRLSDGIEHYGLSSGVHNSHRALDDVYATLALLLKMAEERDDIKDHINIVGYNMKYGLPKMRLEGVTYIPQGDTMQCSKKHNTTH